MEGPPRPSINHYLHEEMETPTRPLSYIIWLRFQGALSCSVRLSDVRLSNARLSDVGLSYVKLSFILIKGNEKQSLSRPFRDHYILSLSHHYHIIIISLSYHYLLTNYDYFISSPDNGSDWQTEA